MGWNLPSGEDGHEGPCFQAIRGTGTDDVMELPIEDSSQDQVGTDEIVVEVIEDPLLASLQHRSMSLVHHHYSHFPIWNLLLSCSDRRNQGSTGILMFRVGGKGQGARQQLLKTLL